MTERGCTVWFTGLSGAGKTTLARAVRDELVDRRRAVEILDGDEMRATLCRDLGFSRADRDENIRRIGFVARLLSRNGVVALVAAISPYRCARDHVRREHEAPFVEVFVDCPLDIVRSRDTRGLYKAQTPWLTGVSDPYEAPSAPDLHLHTDRSSVAACVSRVLDVLKISSVPNSD